MVNHSVLRGLYARTAHLYEQCVVPVFGPLADDLARWIGCCLTAHLHGYLYDPFDLEPQIDPEALRAVSALDVGAGTGVLARALARYVGRVVALDLSLEMLRATPRTARGGNIALLNTDLHLPGLRDASFGLGAASFGLNATTPRLALRSLARVLRPGGLLIFQEWAALDPLARIVDETFEAHAPADVPDMDEAPGTFCRASTPWYDQMQDAEDYYEMLKRIGFELAWVREAPFTTIRIASVDVFLNYKLVWAHRRLALEAMSPQTRAAFEADVRAQLAPYLNADGSFTWSPSLFRVCAVR